VRATSAWPATLSSLRVHDGAAVRGRLCVLCVCDQVWWCVAAVSDVRKRKALLFSPTQCSAQLRPRVAGWWCTCVCVWQDVRSHFVQTHEWSASMPLLQSSVYSKPTCTLARLGKFRRVPASVCDLPSRPVQVPPCHPPRGCLFAPPPYPSMATAVSLLLLLQPTRDERPLPTLAQLHPASDLPANTPEFAQNFTALKCRAEHYLPRHTTVGRWL
jgi:hypothetical protein